MLKRARNFRSRNTEMLLFIQVRANLSKINALRLNLMTIKTIDLTKLCKVLRKELTLLT